MSNGTTLTASEIDPLELERETAAPPVRRAPRTKEEIELSNLKKKTRKRTRRFEVDGVVVTTTTSKVKVSPLYSNLILKLKVSLFRFNYSANAFLNTHTFLLNTKSFALTILDAHASSIHSPSFPTLSDCQGSSR